MSKALTPVQELKSNFLAMKDQFKAALPNHIAPEKFVRVVQTAVSNNPDLVKANRQSLFSAAMKSAQDGLIPDGRDAALVTFGSSVQYMPMVAGILKKARNSGEIGSITAQVVYEHDDFDYFVDEDGEHISHKPNMFEDRGKAIGVYALAKTKDGAVYVEVLTVKDVNAIKSASRGKKGPWSGPFEHEMWKKSAIRRLSKRLPMSTDLENTIQADDNMYDLDKANSQEAKDVTPPKESRLKTLIADEEPEVISDDIQADEEVIEADIV